MTTKTKKSSRLRREILAMAKDMHATGTMDDATYAQILARRSELVAVSSHDGLLKSLNSNN